MKVICPLEAPYCSECGLHLSVVRDPSGCSGKGFVFYSHIGNTHCENTRKVIRLPVTLIDAEEVIHE